MLKYEPLIFDIAIKIDDGSNPVKYINEEFEILLYNHRIQRAKVDNSNIAKLDILNLKFDYYSTVDLSSFILTYTTDRFIFVNELNQNIPRIQNDEYITFYINNLCDLYKGETLWSDNKTYFHKDEYINFPTYQLNNLYTIITLLNLKIYPYRTINRYEYINQQINDQEGNIINIWVNYIPYVLFINLMYKNINLYINLYQSIIDNVVPKITDISLFADTLFDNRNNLENKIDILLNNPKAILSFKDLVKYANDELNVLLHFKNKVNSTIQTKSDKIQTISTGTVYLSEELYALSETLAYKFYDLNNDLNHTEYVNDTLITFDIYNTIKSSISNIDSKRLKKAYKIFIDNGLISLREIGYSFNNSILIY